jgi:hypothetical protein
MKYVFICAGHGGGDSGAVARNTTEAEQTVLITNKLFTLIEPDSDLTVYQVPNELDLVESIAWVNAQVAKDSLPFADCLAIDIHKNSAEVNVGGVETWYFGGDQPSAELASRVQVKAKVNLNDRGIKGDNTNRHGSLGWIRETNIPALLVECGFISGTVDPLGAEPYASALYAGIRNALGLPAKSPVGAPSQPPVVVAPATPSAAWTYKVTQKSTGKQLGVYTVRANAWNKYTSVNGDAIISDASGADVTAGFVAEFNKPVATPLPEPVRDEDIEAIKAEQARQGKILDLILSIVQSIRNLFK